MSPKRQREDSATSTAAVPTNDDVVVKTNKI